MVLMMTKIVILNQDQELPGDLSPSRKLTNSLSGSRPVIKRQQMQDSDLFLATIAICNICNLAILATLATLATLAMCNLVQGPT